jgi:putative transposase
MRSYRRRLPHIDAAGLPVFLTWRLHGSLAPGRTFEGEHLTSGEAFVAWDRLLDTARTGPLYLRKIEIACLVQEQLLKSAADGLCSIDAFVIMPNHVHLLCKPTAPIGDLMRLVKGSTACAANRILGLRGEKFWQEEYLIGSCVTPVNTTASVVILN